MIKEIRVMPYANLKGWMEKEFMPDGELFISITCPDVTNTAFNSIVHSDDVMDRVLRQQFWDADPTALYQIFERKSKEYLGSFGPNSYFTEKHAAEIVEFLDRWKGVEEDYNLNVNCMAGISRSGAVATFACEYLELDMEHFRNENSWIQPNAYILAMLRRRFWGVTT